MLYLSSYYNRESLLLGESLFALQNQSAVQVHATSITIQLHEEELKYLSLFRVMVCFIIRIICMLLQLTAVSPLNLIKCSS